MFLRDWETRLDEFLRFNERAVLPDADAMSREAADRRALGEYHTFHERRLGQADAEAAADTIHRLAELAKALPTRRRGKGSKARKGKS